MGILISELEGLNEDNENKVDIWLQRSERSRQKKENAEDLTIPLSCLTEMLPDNGSSEESEDGDWMPGRKRKQKKKLKAETKEKKAKQNQESDEDNKEDSDSNNTPNKLNSSKSKQKNSKKKSNESKKEETENSNCDKDTSQDGKPNSELSVSDNLAQ